MKKEKEIKKTTTKKATTTKKPVAKKPVAKKPVAKKPDSKKPIAKKETVKKVAEKKTIKKEVTKKPVAKKKAPKKPRRGKRTKKHLLAEDGRRIILRVQNLEKSFGNTKALKGVSFDLHEGESISLIGGNGAGKTTMVEIILGLNKQDAGRIIYAFDYQNSFRERIGIQFQDSKYPPGLKTRHIANYIMRINGSRLSKDELKDIIARFKMEEFWNRAASSLSGGQSQKLNILLALINKPKILILDELSTGLDVVIRKEVVTFIKEYCTQNDMSLILISHYTSEIKDLTNRIIVLKEGVIQNEKKIKDSDKIHDLNIFINENI